MACYRQPHSHPVHLKIVNIMVLLKLCIRYELIATICVRYFDGLNLQRSDEYLCEKLKLPICHRSWQIMKNAMRYGWRPGTENTNENVLNSLQLQAVFLFRGNQLYYDIIYNICDV